MKRLLIRDNRDDDRPLGGRPLLVWVETPWLGIMEATLYCGFRHRQTFTARAIGIPFAGAGRTRRYHVGVLDRWISGELDVPFVPDKPRQPEGCGRPKKRRRSTTAPLTLKDPGTGKQYPAGEKNRKR